MLDGLVPQPERELMVVKSFKIRPSDWAEVEKVAARYRILPTAFVRTILMLGLEEAKKKLAVPR